MDQNDRPELETKLAELEILKQSVDQAKATGKKAHENFLKMVAELDNFRKRSENRIRDSRKAGREDTILGLLALWDVFEHADQASQSAKDLDSLKKGLSLLKVEFEKFFKEHGVKTIDSQGVKLDPHLHEVVAQDSQSDEDEGTITDVIQKGYTVFDRVVRPARVRVSSKPKTTADS